MNKKEITTLYDELTYDELSPEERTLVDEAREATSRSYAPYSKFRVGAAIRLDNGIIVPGSNQENVAFPSGTCAERSACFYAHARYPEAKFKMIAIAARGTDGEFIAEPVAPAAHAVRRFSNTKLSLRPPCPCSSSAATKSTASHP